MSDEPMEQVEIPGGYTTPAEALHALTHNTQMRDLAADAKRRLGAALGTAKAVWDQAEYDRQEALRAVEIFAQIAPDQLGGSCTAEMREGSAQVMASVSDLEREVEELVRQAGGMDL